MTNNDTYFIATADAFGEPSSDTLTFASLDEAIAYYSTQDFEFLDAIILDSNGRDVTPSTR